MYTRNYREVTPLIMGKIDSHLKQLQSKDKRKKELSFTSIKQEAECFIYSNNKWSDLLQKRKDFVYKFTRCERLLDLYGECLQEEPMYIPQKFRNDKTDVTSQEELNVVRKNDLNQGIIEKKYGRIGFWPSQKRLQLGVWGEL